MTSSDPPPPTVWPALRARDPRGLIAFLVDALGFENTVVYGDQPDGSGDVVVHAEISWPEGGGIMLGSARDVPDDPWPVQPGSSGCYVVTADPDKVHARAVAAGADIVTALHDTDYGSREFAVRDPEGNRWSFGTYRGAPRSTP
jgi:uncharacterized glyoxalase superfamily protein PhnB